VADQVRLSAKQAVERFKELGLSSMGIISGDQPRAVQRLADELGLNQTWSGLKPHEKLQVIKDMQEKGRRVMYVGDGVNDAPALAQAEVGVAMGAAGSEVALETSDVALTHDEVARLPFLIRLGRRMLFIIKLNIAFGLVFNAVAVIASGGGYLSPISAALVHNIGSVLVVISAASLAVLKDKA
jgi:Cd2+/Zn2+-exporting ATPase